MGLGRKCVRWGWVGFLLLSQLAMAMDAVPSCPAFALKQQNGGDPGSLPVNNDQVLRWKRAGEQDSSNNNYHDRGHVQGTVVQVYPDRNGHNHFSVKVGPDANDTVEVVYNQDFGSVPDPQVGMPVEACGDYITSVAPTPGPSGQTYPASPDHALIHWVHMAPARSGHNSGFLVVNGVLTGQDAGNAGPRPGHHPH